MTVGVVGWFFLDVFFEYSPGEVSETQTPVLTRVEEEVLGIHRLGLGDLNVDFSEIRR